MFTLQSATQRSFSRRNGARGAQSRDPMTLDAIRAIAPSIFAGRKHDSRSDRYTYIPTSQIVEHLIGQSYGVFAAMRGGSRDEIARRQSLGTKCRDVSNQPRS